MAMTHFRLPAYVLTVVGLGLVLSLGGCNTPPPKGPMSYRYPNVTLARFSEAFSESLTNLGFTSVFVTTSGKLYILQDQDKANPSQATFILDETPEGLMITLNATQFILIEGLKPISGIPKFLQLVEKTNQILGVTPVRVGEGVKK